MPFVTVNKHYLWQFDGETVTVTGQS